MFMARLRATHKPYIMDNEDLINDLNEIEALAKELNVLSSMLISKCQRTRSKLTKADVSTLAEARLNAIRQQAVANFRAHINKKIKAAELKNKL